MATSAAKPDVGTVSVITGGSSGIGAALAKLMASRGSKVAIGDINIEGAKALANEINEKAGETLAIGVEVDVTDWDSQLKFFAAAKEKFGRIDYVFANAGILEIPFLPKELPADSFVKPGMKTIEVNQTGQIYTVALGIQYFLKQSPGVHGFLGKVIVTASLAGILYMPAAPQYSTSKSAMVTFVSSLSHRYVDQGITINALLPNFVETAIVPSSQFWDIMRPHITQMSTVMEAAERFLGDSKLNGACLVANSSGVYAHPNKNEEQFGYEQNSVPLAVVSQIAAAGGI